MPPTEAQTTAKIIAVIWFVSTLVLLVLAMPNVFYADDHFGAPIQILLGGVVGLAGLASLSIGAGHVLLPFSLRRHACPDPFCEAWTKPGVRVKCEECGRDMRTLD